MRYYERASRAGSRPIRIRGAVDDSETYRWWLEWSWDAGADADGEDVAVFIGCNPVHRGDTYDSTTRACYEAVEDRVGRLLLVNLYAFRHPDPKALLTVDDPVGDENEEVLRRSIAEASTVVLCWGDIGAAVDPPRAAEVRSWAGSPLVFGTTRAGNPWHPGYANRRGALRLQPFGRAPTG
jgi:hypothetical protein